MRFFADDCETLTPVQWYFTKRTDFIENTAFCSSIWDEPPRIDGCPVGEVGGPIVWCNGKLPPGALSGDQPCGTSEQWAGKITTADAESAPCADCTMDGQGCFCFAGKGLFAGDTGAGLGCLCYVGGFLSGNPMAPPWQGDGCFCFSSTSVSVYTNPCLCFETSTLVSFEGLCLCFEPAMKYGNEALCLCFEPRTAVITSGLCVCIGPAGNEVIPSDEFIISPCCPDNYLRPVMQGTLTVSNCPCATDQALTFTYDPASGNWYSEFFECCGLTVRVSMECLLTAENFISWIYDDAGRQLVSQSASSTYCPGFDFSCVMDDTDGLLCKGGQFRVGVTGTSAPV